MSLDRFLSNPFCMYDSENEYEDIKILEICKNLSCDECKNDDDDDENTITYKVKCRNVAILCEECLLGNKIFVSEFDKKDIQKQIAKLWLERLS